MILLDAGHGIDTPGKRSPDGSFREYLWNRQVADIVLDELRFRHYDCGLVVTETNDIPLKTRAMRVNKACDIYGKDKVILVSIHSNAAGDGSRWMTAKGWSCYTSVGETASDELAECFYDAFERAFPERTFRKDLTDGDRDLEEDFYILKKTRCKAVLLENFFYDNLLECRWLLTEGAKERIAIAIVNALKIYLSNPFI